MCERERKSWQIFSLICLLIGEMAKQATKKEDGEKCDGGSSGAVGIILLLLVVVFLKFPLISQFFAIKTHYSCFFLFILYLSLTTCLIVKRARAGNNLKGKKTYERWFNQTFAPHCNDMRKKCAFSLSLNWSWVDNETFSRICVCVRSSIYAILNERSSTNQFNLLCDLCCDDI